MEEKYTKTLENVLILADDEVIEICIKQSYHDKHSQKIYQDTNLTKRKLSTETKKHQHLGLNIKEKRRKRKSRHYSLRIVNFNTVVLQDACNKEYYLVFYRSDKEFNANVANFYFSGPINNIKHKVFKRQCIVRHKTRQQRKQSTKKDYLKKQKPSELLKMKKRHNKTLKFVNVSFKTYLRNKIKYHYHKYLDGEHGMISVHAIFTVDNQEKSKIFITRDIEKTSDITRFIKVISKFDTSLKMNTYQRLEMCLQNMGIPMDKVQIVSRINQTNKRNVFIELSDKVPKCLRKKIAPDLLINSKLLNLGLNSVRFTGAKDGSVASFVNMIDELVTNVKIDGNIEEKLQKQLDSCKTFIACLDAIEAKKMFRNFADLSVESESVCETNSIVLQCCLNDNVVIKQYPDENVEYILGKIDHLQKKIRMLVKKSPSLSKDVDIQSYLMKSESSETLQDSEPPSKHQLFDTSLELKETKSIQKKNLLLQQLHENSMERIKNDFVSLETILKTDNVLKNEIIEIKEETKNVEEVPENPPKIVEDEVPPKEPSKDHIEDKPKEPVKQNIDDKSTMTTLRRKRKIPQTTEKLSKVEEFLKKEFPNIEGQPKLEQFLKVVHQLEEELPKPEKSEGTTSKLRKRSRRTGSAKSINKKRPKQHKTTNKENIVQQQTTEQPNVIKLENFIDQILNITKQYFANGNSNETEEILKNIAGPTEKPQISPKSETNSNSSTVITIKKFSGFEDTCSEVSTNTIKSYLRKTRVVESAAQTQTDVQTSKKKRTHTKLTQTVFNCTTTITEVQTDISIHKNAQIRFPGPHMQLSKNVTITNVKKNIISVRNICEETTNNNDIIVDLPQIDVSPKDNNKNEILNQIKSTLENVTERFKKNTLLITKATNFKDISDNLKKMSDVPIDLDVATTNKPPESELLCSNVGKTKEEITSNLTMSLKLLKNLSDVTKTIRKNPKEAAKKLHGIRNELMQYRKYKMYCKKNSLNNESPQLSLSSKKSSSSSSTTNRRMERAVSSSIFPKNMPLNMYGYPASNTLLKSDLNRIFTPKTRSICNTELSIIKHRDRHADHIASHLSKNNSKNKLRSQSMPLKTRKRQMYIAKTYKKSYAKSVSQTLCNQPPSSNIPQIQTAIENPLVPKIVRPVRWRHQLPDSPQLSNLTLKDVKPFNSEYPRKDHVSVSSHSYLDRLLKTNITASVKCSDNDCSKCFERQQSCPDDVTKKESKNWGNMNKKGQIHFKSNTTTTPGVSRQINIDSIPDQLSTPRCKFDFTKFMVDPVKNDYLPNMNIPKVNFTVCPVNVLQNNKQPNPKDITTPETSYQKLYSPFNKKLSEAKNNQNKIQKSIQQAIIKNQEKFQAMQRILTLSKPQENKKTVSNPGTMTTGNASPSSTNRNSPAGPKIKSSHTKKVTSTVVAEPSTSKSTSKNFPVVVKPIQASMVTQTIKTTKHVQPHPKLKHIQQQQQQQQPKIRPPIKQPVNPNSSKVFDKKYAEEDSLSSIKSIPKMELKPKMLNQISKTVKKSQEDIQKYIALVEQKFLKTFSLNEQEKEGAYKNLVVEIQDMLNVLNSKDKTEKKMKIKKSLEKLAKEENNETKQKVKLVLKASQKKEPTTEAVKNEEEESSCRLSTDYVKTLESVEKSLKLFETNFAENSKLNEAAAEKLQTWRKEQQDEASPPDVSNIKPSTSDTSERYTLSEKEQIIEQKITELPVASKQNSSIVVLKEPNSLDTIHVETSDSIVMDVAKKKNL